MEIGVIKNLLSYTPQDEYEKLAVQYLIELELAY